MYREHHTVFVLVLQSYVCKRTDTTRSSLATSSGFVGFGCSQSRDRGAKFPGVPSLGIEFPNACEWPVEVSGDCLLRALRVSMRVSTVRERSARGGGSSGAPD